MVTVHRPLLGLQFTHELLHVTIYMRTIYIRSFHVSIATVLVFFQMYVLLQLYDHFDIGTVSSVFMNLCFNEFAEPSTRT